MAAGIPRSSRPALGWRRRSRTNCSSITAISPMTAARRHHPGRASRLADASGVPVALLPGDCLPLGEEPADCIVSSCPVAPPISWCVASARQLRRGDRGFHHPPARRGSGVARHHRGHERHPRSSGFGRVALVAAAVAVDPRAPGRELAPALVIGELTIDLVAYDRAQPLGVVAGIYSFPVRSLATVREVLTHLEHYQASAQELARTWAGRRAPRRW